VTRDVSDNSFVISALINDNLELPTEITYRKQFSD
jgi:hypothetical protein